jgi:hypothetical protein
LPKINFQVGHNDTDRFAEVIRFVRSRIPPKDRGCWSVYVTPPQRLTPHMWSHLKRTLYFWFSERYAWVGVEMKMHFG